MRPPLNKQHRFAAGFRSWYPWLGVLVLAYLAMLTVHHYEQLTVPLWRIPVIILSFVWLLIIIGAAHFNRTYKDPAPNEKVAVVVPNHREDPFMLRAMLDSLDAQTRLPYALYLVENGETDGNAKIVFEEWKKTTQIPRVIFVHLPNPGKRDAQAWAIQREQEATIIMTVDGDTRLDPFAIEEGLKPFADTRVMSVAGLLIGQNRSANLLTRIIDISFVASFVNGRAAWSLFNSVAVNCGGLAFYRTWVVKKHLVDYLSQTVMGKKASTGDDRMLTCYSALEGRTVFQ